MLGVSKKRCIELRRALSGLCPTRLSRFVLAEVEHKTCGQIWGGSLRANEDIDAGVHGVSGSDTRLLI